MRKLDIRLSQTILLAIAPAALSQALAQGPTEAADAATLDAVIVTANKRAENVQEVPKSIAVLAPEALSKAGINNILDLGNAIPSITGTAPPSALYTAPPIRGVTSFSYSIGVQAQTGIVVDDIPQHTFSTLSNELADIEQVEVLAGPQSTLSGRNASAGLINIVTRAPSETLMGEISLEHTSDNQERWSAFISAPIQATLGFSVSAFSNQWDGPNYNIVENRRMNGWDTQGARGKLRWQPVDRLSATLTAWALRSETIWPGLFSTGPYIYADPAARYNFDTLGRTMEQMYAGISPAPYSTRIGSPRHSVSKTKERGASLRVDYDLSTIGTLTSLSSWSSTDRPRYDNFLGVPIEGMDIFAPDLSADVDYETTYKTQELRLTSPGDQRFDYLAGVFWSDTHIWHPYRRLGIFPFNVLRTSDMETLALFTRGTWNLTPHDALIAGIRYQRDDMAWYLGLLPNTRDAQIPDAQGAGGSTYDFFSGEISWRHQLAEQVNAYLTLSRTQNGRAYDLEDTESGISADGLPALDSQKVRNLELGLKSQWWQRRLTLNANLFLARYDNYQVQTTVYSDDDIGAVPTVRLYAIGKVETKGIELTSRLRATSRLDLSANAAWLKAEIKDYPNPQCYIRQSAEQGCDLDTGLQNNLAGQRMPNTPEFRVSGSASYFVALDRLPFDLELGAFYRWQSKAMFDLYGNPNLYQKGYGVLNLSAAVHDRNGRYSVSVFINNALDRNFYADLADDQFWNAPAYRANYARDSFRYAGMNLRINF